MITRNEDHVTGEQRCLLPFLPGEFGFAFVDDPNRKSLMGMWPIAGNFLTRTPRLKFRELWVMPEFGAVRYCQIGHQSSGR